MCMRLTVRSSFSSKAECSMRYLERFDTKILLGNAEDLYWMIKNFAQDHEIPFADAKDIILTAAICSQGSEQHLSDIAKKMDRLA